MAEQHTAVSNSTATWQFFLQQLYTFVSGTQSGIVRFASGSGGYVGIKSGGTVQGTDHALASGFGSDNDYIIVEPVNEYPGGDRWQMKFQGIDVSDDETSECSVEVSWLGGFSKANDDAGDPFGSNQTTGAKTIWASQKATTADTWYFSCANSDTYQNSAGTQTYTYMRVLLYDAGASENAKFNGTYCGGYIPNEPDNDTKPVVWFAKLIKGANSTNNWGDIDGTNTGLAPGNYAHDTGGGNISAYINTVSDTYTGYGNTRSGNWSNGPTLIIDNNNNTTLGAFGKFTQMVGDLDRNDGATDSNADYKVAADQVIRWNPD